MSTVKTATMIAFDSGTYTATIRYEESLTSYQSGIPVASHLSTALLPAGAKVAVLVFDEHVATDRVIVASYGFIP